MGIKNLFNKCYKGKRVLVTGHTGFKGSWLSLWLKELEADVTGYSLYLPSDPCHFSAIGLEAIINHIIGDVRDFEHLNQVFESIKPEIVFHLAAQPIVRISYDEPKKTFDTNLGGTVNILECIKRSSSVKSAVIITSDKCYKNSEWMWGYREEDALGGDDPYGASKACAEIACKTYASSFFCNKKNKPSIATTRAGNVIGGGDWAMDRIVPDCIRAWTSNKILKTRNPRATRPWQHVLEPISGYLLLGSRLYHDQSLCGEPFNFGPDQSFIYSVEQVITALSRYWRKARWQHDRNKEQKKECKLLKLSNEKVGSVIGWKPLLSFNETIRLTALWYKQYTADHRSNRRLSLQQIRQYTASASKENYVWTN
ncbi:MAG: CDP-glucose 4,6-dehydratase [Elusimicrobia bacterium]|nr:CDP-glucose 4,6-dehydratase [Elusimicrobiota bacterium]MBD3412264.1 CDP-glucose 4,6-dehydratase [Elusimicrobiota bacterium]